MVKHNFRKLKIWKESIELVFETYKITKTFPNKEKFGLTSQLNRCSVSIPSNIAEGTSKSSDKHFNNFLETSLGSAFEWETQIIIANGLEYITDEKYYKLIKNINDIQKMISSFKEKLQ
jgi:four helix bundle protein